MNEVETNQNFNNQLQKSGTAGILTIIGGGAAGFFCAVNAAKFNPLLKIIILERSNKILGKVKVSGGGRCNVTHACFDIDELVKKYPRGQNFLKKSFHWFNTKNTIDWFEERGVKLKTEPDGRMFPLTNTSQTIIDCLLKEADKYKVEIHLQTDVQSFEKVNDVFHVKTSNAQLQTDFLCIACGGFPKASQFYWLKQTGHSIADPVPSLFTFNIPNNKITELMGISVEKATVKIAATKLLQQSPLLITHWGLSGPAILRASAFGAILLAEKKYQFTGFINWLSDFTEQSLRNEWQTLRSKFSSQKIYYKNPFSLPARLWVYLLNESEIDENKTWSDLSAKQQNKLIQFLTANEFQVNGKTTFKEEFVTCGGINLAEIDANTMQSKLIENLFFAGEVMNVDGITGGFNFQHAWTSGYIAAKAIAEKSIKD